jgi:DNA replication protein DnaC
MFWPEVMKKLTAFDEYPGEVRAELEQQILSLDFVVLDDVGREHRKEGSTWVPSNVDSLFRQRMHLGVPTILTSNFSMGQVRSMYGDSLASVFRGNLVEIHVASESDYRPIEGAQMREKLFARVSDE